MNAPSVGVVIPTVNRPDALRRVLRAVKDQSLPPAQVVVSVPERGMLPADVLADDFVTCIDGARGAAAQRNVAVRALRDDISVVAFLDDDAVPRNDYLERAVEVLSRTRGAVGVSGRVVLDGAALGRALTPEEMSAALERSWSERDDRVVDSTDLYGANMVIRADHARNTPFDERLPLYSWLEDLDLSRRLARHGRVLHALSLVAVHQGSDSGGRTQHRRLGYSQVVNPVYLWRKGSVRPAELARLVGRPVLGTLRGVLCPSQRAGRFERLRGMWLGLSDLARGRITPERITEL